jgi:hypothetical protein
MPTATMTKTPSGVVGPPPARDQRRRQNVLVTALLASLAVVPPAASLAGGPAGPVTSAQAGAQRLERAVVGAEVDRTYRVKGTVTFGVPLLSWDGIVVGGDEQYILHTLGRVIDSRRIGGRNWWRPLGSSEPWKLAPADTPLDLAVLLRGEVVAARHKGDRWALTLHFHDVDVLAALTHVPSAGPTTAEVTLVDDRITAVTLRLSAFGGAELSFRDHGASLSIDPVAGG